MARRCVQPLEIFNLCLVFHCILVFRTFFLNLVFGSCSRLFVATHTLAISPTYISVTDSGPTKLDSIGTVYNAQSYMGASALSFLTFHLTTVSLALAFYFYCLGPFLLASSAPTPFHSSSFSFSLLSLLFFFFVFFLFSSFFWSSLLSLLLLSCLLFVSLLKRTLSASFLFSFFTTPVSFPLFALTYSSFFSCVFFVIPFSFLSFLTLCGCFLRIFIFFPFLLFFLLFGLILVLSLYPLFCTFYVIFFFPIFFHIRVVFLLIVFSFFFVIFIHIPLPHFCTSPFVRLLICERTAFSFIVIYYFLYIVSALVAVYFSVCFFYLFFSD